jgi:hypothetical protein
MADGAQTDDTQRDPWADLPRAPSSEAWARMTPAERRRVVDALPSEVPRRCLPEGDLHFNAKMQARTTLDDFFARIGRQVYLACELPVYYPEERMIAPDLMAVVDVGLHERMRWVVDEEGRGLDLALEIVVAGDRRKDLEGNVERYARLGIREYFVFDRGRLHLAGWRLGEGRRYRSIVPQFGRFHSEVLGLDLRQEDRRLRFYVGAESLPSSAELVGTLGGMIQQLEERAQRTEAEFAETQAQLGEQLREAEARAAAEAAARGEAEAKLAAALAEIERLRRQP